MTERSDPSRLFPASSSVSDLKSLTPQLPAGLWKSWFTPTNFAHFVGRRQSRLDTNLMHHLRDDDESSGRRRVSCHDRRAASQLLAFLAPLLMIGVSDVIGPRRSEAFLQLKRTAVVILY